MVSNAPKQRDGVIVDVLENTGNTHAEIISTDENLSRQELGFDVVGTGFDWAKVGCELEYETETA